MIGAGCLAWFVKNLIRTVNEEDEERFLWDLYLHPRFDNRSFEQFKNDARRNARKKEQFEIMQKDPTATVEILNKTAKVMEQFNSQ